MNERILHVSLETSFERQPALKKALASLGEYRCIDWLAREDTVSADLVDSVREFKPTITFMQIQRASRITPETVVRMREAHGHTIINWDGDQHHEPADQARRWFVELGKVCDASLVCNTQHPRLYRELGVRNPGYLQIGVDETIYRPLPASQRSNRVPNLVFLGSRYSGNNKYEARRQACDLLWAKYGSAFRAYGCGWRKELGTPTVTQTMEPVLYSSARGALCMSICNHLPRYSSDRLWRALGSSAVAMVERFPDMEAVGAVEGETCLAWTTHDELLECAAAAMRGGLDSMRRQASAIVHRDHTWQARMPQLMEIVESVR